MGGSEPVCLDLNETEPRLNILDWGGSGPPKMGIGTDPTSAPIPETRSGLNFQVELTSGFEPETSCLPSQSGFSSVRCQPFHPTDTYFISSHLA